ncbi:nitroreductase family deazaflavin-dependent oxidoreductase [Georgenia subflava]|uniref:Nitroreductase family deazaflavin-dependent oxidoreductase n=1 Tax=Georgenia subflava TaxID=1622177 RepID=A0A6N7EKS6_9MICO|nr:nitroreductase family deazaflavin-dependent oxidoreductase [Georgenia subflava]MPV37417.1 nitroreductase family deazaflavin-dependent oxidoreductase [Georgenia subflava]
MTTDSEYAPSPRPHVRDQVEEFERSDGAQANTMRGLPIVVITTRGARTGKIRKVPLMRVEHEGDYAIVASQGGAPKHPVWYHNVLADPHVVLQDGAERWDMTARELAGEERDAWWARAVEAFPPYADYQEKTDRLIPVFVLERRS